MHARFSHANRPSPRDGQPSVVSGSGVGQVYSSNQRSEGVNAFYWSSPAHSSVQQQTREAKRVVLSKFQASSSQVGLSASGQKNRRKQKKRNQQTVRLGLVMVSLLSLLGLVLLGITSTYNWLQPHFKPMPGVANTVLVQQPVTPLSVTEPWTGAPWLPSTLLVRQTPLSGFLFLSPMGWCLEESRRYARQASLFDIPLATYFTEGTLQRSLIQLAEAFPSITPHVLWLDPVNRRSAQLASTDAVSSASVIKLGLLYLYLHGLENQWFMPDTLVWFEERHRVSGSGSWQGRPAHTSFSTYQVAEAMIQTSDNCATEVMVELLGGAKAVNQQLAQLGFSQTRLRAQLPDHEGYNTISPQEMVQLLVNLKTHPALSQATKEIASAILEGTVNRRLLPGLLPPSTKIAHKTGDIGKSLGDSGIVYLPNGSYYYLSIMVERPHNSPDALAFIQQASKLIYDWASKRNPALAEVAGVEGPYSPIPSSGAFNPNGSNEASESRELSNPPSPVNTPQVEVF
jgi:beta-lactamase class A